MWYYGAAVVRYAWYFLSMYMNEKTEGMEESEKPSVKVSGHDVDHAHPFRHSTCFFRLKASLEPLKTGRHLDFGLGHSYIHMHRYGLHRVGQS